MQVIGLHTRLRPGLEQTYERIHARLAPEHEQALRDSGVHSWHIWRDGLDLFHTIVCEDWVGMEEAMDKLELTHRWHEVIHPLLDMAVSARGPLPLVWKLPEHGASTPADDRTGEVA
ncbi:L-rhamnose mutarotase [Catellatospora tritici]|uniref:L-rhamnose mutarotase n=1 Tax=Catellatospora tritici TaxID=2851566 RepID=UPI001C2D5260|nr:L-rhamnose mutarotase [Catellatospora tritici]MBV1856306.1 L-rhamnose mutarotase [Catellatospora tritici]